MISVVKSGSVFRSISIGIEWGSNPLRLYLGFYKWVVWIHPASFPTKIEMNIYASKVPEP